MTPCNSSCAYVSLQCIGVAAVHGTARGWRAACYAPLPYRFGYLLLAQANSFLLAVTLQLKGLSGLKLLHPPNDRKQQRRWAKLLSESVRLLRLLSTPPSSPSNTAGAARAAAAVAAGDRFGVAAAEVTALAAAGKGLLHGLPSDEMVRLEAWKDLTSCMGTLIKTLDKEVGDNMQSRRPKVQQPMLNITIPHNRCGLYRTQCACCVSSHSQHSKCYAKGW